MSTYDKASLVLIPSGTKTSKIYSQKPINGDGDFSFSRSTSATRVNQSGFIEKETQNLLLHSSNQLNSVYNIQRGLHNQTAVYNPLTGNNDAFKLGKISGEPDPYKGQTIYTSVNGCYTGSIYLWTDSGQPTDCQIFFYNIYVSEVYSKSITLTTTPTRYEFFVNFNNTGGEIRFRLDLSTSTDAYLYTYGWQLERGLAARDYIETTTSAVYGGITDNVPRIDYTDASCPSLLLEPTRTNVIESSEYFDSSLWSATNITITNNDTESPEGIENASKIVFNSGSSNCELRVQNTKLVTLGNDYTFSVFAKADEFDKIELDFSNSRFYDTFVEANLTNGTITSRGVDNTSDSIEDYGNGWYRIILTGTAIATGTTALIFRLDANPTGDGTSGFHIYGAQFEEGYPSSYIPTYGTSVSRNNERPNYLDVTNLTGNAFTIFLDYKDAIKEGSTGNWMYLFNTSNQLLSYVYGGTLMLHSTSGENYTSFTFGDCKVAFVYDGTNVKYFLNGTLVKTVTTSTRWDLGAEKYWLYDPYNNTKSTIKYNSFIILQEAITDQEAINLTTT
jgi:hypothetical protein